jgi:hypothetical protein
MFLINKINNLAIFCLYINQNVLVNVKERSFNYSKYVLNY